MSEIKWSYNPQSGSFAALPASKLLLPFILFGGVVFATLLERGYQKYQEKPKPLPPNFNKNLYNQYREKWLMLRNKEKSGKPLTVNERSQIYNLEHPPWSTKGETWHYY